MQFPPTLGRNFVVLFVLKMWRTVGRFYAFVRDRFYAMVDACLDVLVTFLCRHYESRGGQQGFY
jgi:hypothetical protein